jgi:hypothetical protein
MPYQIASARKNLLAELGYAAQMTEDRIADIHGGRGEIGFIQSALQKSSGGQDEIPRTGAQAQGDDQ